MIIDISSIVTCENKSLTEKVQIELESFVSRLGEFPIIEKAPIDLQIANIDGGKLRISGTVEDIDYLIGFDLDVDKLIYGEILVNWPMKVLCKEDCKGICKVCGMNLNKGDCNCQRTELDPRMAAIQDVFNKFKEV